MNQDVGETQIARQLVDRYPELSGYISFQGLKKLARRALLRGYSEQVAESHIIRQKRRRYIYQKMQDRIR